VDPNSSDGYPVKMLYNNTMGKWWGVDPNSSDGGGGRHIVPGPHGQTGAKARARPQSHRPPTDKKIVSRPVVPWGCLPRRSSRPLLFVPAVARSLPKGFCRPLQFFLGGRPPPRALSGGASSSGSSSWGLCELGARSACSVPSLFGRRPLFRVAALPPRGRSLRELERGPQVPCLSCLQHPLLPCARRGAEGPGAVPPPPAALFGGGQAPRAEEALPLVQRRSSGAERRAFPARAAPLFGGGQAPRAQEAPPPPPPAWLPVSAPRGRPKRRERQGKHQQEPHHATQYVLSVGEATARKE